MQAAQRGAAVPAELRVGASGKRSRTADPLHNKGPDTQGHSRS